MSKKHSKVFISDGRNVQASSVASSVCENDFDALEESKHVVRIHVKQSGLSSAGINDAPSMPVKSQKMPVSPRRSSVERNGYVVPNAPLPPAQGRRVLLLVWISTVFTPWFLQVRSYVELLMPHKISQDLTPANAAVAATREAQDLARVCPVKGLQIAGSWWNLHPTHYYTSSSDSSGAGDHICHFVVPQYNIHGAYHVDNTDGVSKPVFELLPASCGERENQFAIDYYFYHGSIGFYSFYEEGTGAFCAEDSTAYVMVGKLGSNDINGKLLAEDVPAPGGGEYRQSYYYGLFGAIWIGYRALVLRRSFIICSRYARRCAKMREVISMRHAVVFVQESARLAAHGARNYQRAMLLYLLVEGLMGDLFLLIAKDGALAKVQYISLGYNLSSVLSILFEMLESMHWLGRFAQVFKRVLFNYETAMVGELLCAALMQAFLTALNRSDFRDSYSVVEAVSYYIWSLVGHGAIVLGLAGFILTVRALGAVVFMRAKFGSFGLVFSSCCVDSVLGVRVKMIQLSGYVRSSVAGGLYYSPETLKSLGVLLLATREEDGGEEFLVLHRLHWMTTPQDDLLIVAKLVGSHAELCADDHNGKCGVLRVCERALGGVDHEEEEGHGQVGGGLVDDALVVLNRDEVQEREEAADTDTDTDTTHLLGAV